MPTRTISASISEALYAQYQSRHRATRFNKSQWLEYMLQEAIRLDLDKPLRHGVEYNDSQQSIPPTAYRAPVQPATTARMYIPLPSHVVVSDNDPGQFCLQGRWFHRPFEGTAPPPDRQVVTDATELVWYIDTKTNTAWPGAKR